MQTEDVRIWSPEEHETWQRLYSRLKENRAEMAHPIFAEGLKKLGMTGDQIPNMADVNKRLKALTGWEGIMVEGLEGAESFYPALAKRQFPVGNFIRDKEDLNYTPAPDVFHDAYGHLPFYANKDYADACADYCQRTSKYVDQKDKLRMFERFFWFTYEFALVETPKGRRIFGGGILSSYGESIYSLSDKPNVRPFNIEEMIHQDFRIDVFQETLFVLESPEQLYNCNAQVEAAISNAATDI